MNPIIEREWTTASGLKAVCVFHPKTEHRCGYVEVPVSHPLFGVGYMDQQQWLQPLLKSILAGESAEGPNKRGILSIVGLAASGGTIPSPEMVCNVHGSLTYSDARHPAQTSADPASWWFGFDCAHHGDRVRRSAFGWEEVTYSSGVERTLEFVSDECESLAKQLTALTSYAKKG